MPDKIHHAAAYPAIDPPRYTEIPITFGPEDAQGLYFLNQDPLVISSNIVDFEVWRILIDGVAQISSSQRPSTR